MCYHHSLAANGAAICMSCFLSSTRADLVLCDGASSDVNTQSFSTSCSFLCLFLRMPSGVLAPPVVEVHGDRRFHQRGDRQQRDLEEHVRARRHSSHGRDEKIQQRVGAGQVVQPCLQAAHDRVRDFLRRVDVDRHHRRRLHRLRLVLVLKTRRLRIGGVGDVDADAEAAHLIAQRVGEAAQRPLGRRVARVPHERHHRRP
mmetsp:Transcript_47143/g.116688  ORF Transcript_47143/g.116688 Transcript_47143/m.116688 type:complete len:201 (-) Transcript_47143:343-945(-)